MREHRDRPDIRFRTRQILSADTRNTPLTGYLNRMALAAYWAAMLCMAWFMVSQAAFGLIDDHSFFNPGLLHGHWQLFWGNVSGRFYPLDAKEFLILNEAGVLSATLYYAIQAAKLCLAAWLIPGILRRFGATPLQALAAAALLLTSPAYLVSATRLFVPELNSFTLFLVMLRFMPGPGETRTTWRFWLSLTAAFLALYYKEPGFIALGAMGAVLTLTLRGREGAFAGPSDPPGAALASDLGGPWAGGGGRRNGQEAMAAVGSGTSLARRFAAGLLAAAATCALAYYLFGYRYRGQQDYTAGRQYPLQDVVNYFLGHDMLFLAALAVLCAVALLDLAARWRSQGCAAQGTASTEVPRSAALERPAAHTGVAAKVTVSAGPAAAARVQASPPETAPASASTDDALALASLTASVLYAGVFLALRITSPWYLLPAYALALPALGRVLGRARAWGKAAKGLALSAILVAGASSVAGGVHIFQYNLAATTGAEALMKYLEEHRHKDGSKTVILVPRMEKASEIAHGLYTILEAKGLGSAYEFRYGEHEDPWQFLRSNKGHVLLTPYTDMSDRELISLGECYSTLLSTPAGLPDYSFAGVWRKFLASPLPFEAFLAGVHWSHGNFELLAGDMAACSAPFDWSAIRVEAAADGLKICPLGRSELALRVTNTADTPFIRPKNDPEGRARIVVFAVRPGEPNQPLGEVDLPLRLEPGQSVELRASLRSPGWDPVALAGCLGMIHHGNIYFTREGLLFIGHCKPELEACLPGGGR